MSLIQSAKPNGHDPYAYLKDVVVRLPMQGRQSPRRASASSLATHITVTRGAVVKTGSPRAYKKAT